jgi:hypothetical protein
MREKIMKYQYDIEYINPIKNFLVTCKTNKIPNVIIMFIFGFVGNSDTDRFIIEYDKTDKININKNYNWLQECIKYKIMNPPQFRNISICGKDRNKKKAYKSASLYIYYKITENIYYFERFNDYSIKPHIPTCLIYYNKYMVNGKLIPPPFEFFIGENYDYEENMQWYSDNNLIENINDEIINDSYACYASNLSSNKQILLNHAFDFDDDYSYTKTIIIIYEK